MPMSVVDQLAVGDGEDVFVIARLPVQTQRLQLAVSRRNQRSAWSFVDTTRFYTNDPIPEIVRTADTVGAGNLIQVFQKLDRPNTVPVESDRHTLFEIDRDLAFTFRT